MIIKQTNLNLVYPNLTDYRKKFVNSEEILNENFMPATLFAIPEEVQADVPRIIVQSKNGHSVLNISLSVASFATNYDSGFDKEWSLCETYLNERCSDIYNIIDEMNSTSNIYTGLITRVLIDEIDIPGVDVLSNSLLKQGDWDKLYDLSCKYTFVYKDKYYINITLENTREFEVREVSNGKQCLQKEIKNVISAIIDVNDRYAANFNETYESKKDELYEIISITGEIINSKLLKFICEGVFDYDK